MNIAFYCAHYTTFPLDAVCILTECFISYEIKIQLLELPTIEAIAEI